MKKSILLYAFMALFLSYSCSEAKPKKYKKQIVLISTDFGDMKIKLYDETPKHKQNFLKLADEGYYDGLLFHRVINNFMIQGGMESRLVMAVRNILCRRSLWMVFIIKKEHWQLQGWAIPQIHKKDPQAHNFMLFMGENQPISN